LLSPSIALIISITAILVMIRFKISTGTAVFIGALALSLLSLPLTNLPLFIVNTAFDYETIRLLIIIACALTLSSLMERSGMLTGLATAMESMNPKLALHFIPIVIGLVPMPAGALVSATASKDLAKRTNLSPEESTFINYWFRHIWEFSMPVYPSIILISTILVVSVSEITFTLMPIMVLVIAIGAIFSNRILRDKQTVKKDISENILGDTLKAAWPIILLVAAVLSGLEPFIAFPLVVVVLLLVKKYTPARAQASFKYGFHPKILFLLFAVMLYQTIILESGAVTSIFDDMNTLGLSSILILIGLPFIIGAATGISIAFAGITFPLLVPFLMASGTLDSYALILAYVSGMMGMLVSPVHLCLVMSVEYFEAKLAKVYRYLLPPSFSILTIVIILYLIFSS
jgi:integral membrane protein (TIGR00529 family)